MKYTRAKSLEIARIKNTCLWYREDGIEGVILDPDSMGWSDNNHGCSVFFSFRELSLDQLKQLSKDNVLSSYNECYVPLMGSTKGWAISQQSCANYEGHSMDCTLHNEYVLLEIERTRY